MTIAELDPRLTFESFVVGPANRLASAAARRAADSPGTSYNPLFIYSEPGLGKSHILTATAHRAKMVNPDLRIACIALGPFLEQFGAAFPGSSPVPAVLEGLDMLLLDDVELLAEHADAQECFVHVLSDLAAIGGQVVLASSQAPSEVVGLDPRLSSRFSGGLIVDIATPEYDTRVAIVQKKVEDRGGDLAPGVAELIGRVTVQGVQELTGLINRIMTIQEVEGRQVSTEEIPGLASNLDLEEGDEFGAFVDELAQDVATTVEVSEAPWRRVLREALDAGEGEGYNCNRLRQILDQPTPPPDTRRIVERFTQDVDRLRAIRLELEALGNPWPEAALGVLRDPDRMEEAEGLLSSAHELTRDYPAPPAAPTLDNASGSAAQAGLEFLEPSGVSHSPLYLWTPEGKGATALLAGIGRAYAAQTPQGRVAFIAVRDFAEDFIRALTAGVAGAWRERWWNLDLLLVERIQDLSGTERARDELFHLFEAVARRGGRIALAGDRPPSRIAGIDDRIRARLESGVVVEGESDDVAVAAQSSGMPAFDPVLGGHVYEEGNDDGFPQLAADQPDATDDPDPANPPSLLQVDPASFDSLDELLVDGAAAGPSGFRQGPGKRGSTQARPQVAGSGHDAAANEEEEGFVPAAGGVRLEKVAGWRPTGEEVVWSWPILEDRIVEEGVSRP